MAQVPRAVKLIVAHEWHTTPDVVESWDFTTFLDALQWVSERRYGNPVREQKRIDDRKTARNKNALT